MLTHAISARIPFLTNKWLLREHGIGCHEFKVDLVRSPLSTDTLNLLEAF